jgi:hypothetical protein
MDLTSFGEIENIEQDQTDFISFDEVKNIVQDITDWGVLSDISFNVFFLEKEKPDKTFYKSMEDYYKNLQLFCKEILNCDSWIDNNDVFTTRRQNSDRVVYNLKILKKYHEQISDRRFKPGGDGYLEAKKHFEENK